MSENSRVFAESYSIEVITEKVSSLYRRIVGLRCGVGTSNQKASAMPSIESAVRRLRAEIDVYRLVLKHRGTPRLAKLILGTAVAYAVSPIDLIPDFIPVIGHLDDIVILPVLAWLGLRLIPRWVIDECRAEGTCCDKSDILEKKGP